MDGTGEIVTEGAEVADLTVVGAENDAQNETVTAERDFEAEARAHGWTPKDDFKGDEAKWVDAETFVKRADEVMPFLKKQNEALKREMSDLKRTMKQANAFYTKAEERAYQRAMTDLKARHEDAVERGDTKAAWAVVAELDTLKAEVAVDKPVEKPADEPDPVELRKEFTAWVEENDWYVLDDKKRAYADLQASAMGPANEWEGGQKAWLDEIGKRTARKFAEPKPNPVNGAGNRPGPRGGGKSFSDLPPAAKAQAERFVKLIPGFTKEQYVKDFDWN